jgi:hypothetical protein
MFAGCSTYGPQLSWLLFPPLFSNLVCRQFSYRYARNSRFLSRQGQVSVASVHSRSLQRL